MTLRRVFWPALLIVLGAVALLVNTGAIPTDRLYRLTDLWPVLLIVFGLELLISRARFPQNVEMMASVLVVAIALAGAGVYVAIGPPISSATQTMNVSQPVGDLLRQATLEIDAGAAQLHVQGDSSLDTDLFKAQIQYSGPQPTVTVEDGGRVVVRQDSHFGYVGRESLDVSIQLNTALPWSFAIHSGASRDVYDLSAVTVSSVEIDTGASTSDITLPVPHGNVPVRINGGAMTVHLHRPGGVAASVRVSGGTVSLTFDGERSDAVGAVGHSTAPASDMYSISVNGGACTVTMDAPQG